MQMILRYENGLRADAVLLATSPNRMRVIVRGSTDTMELRLIQDDWMTEEGDFADIESLICGDDVLTQVHSARDAA
jgi:hypothetical protein